MSFSSSDAFFNSIKQRLATGSAEEKRKLLSIVNAVIMFDLGVGANGKETQWLLDLSAKGSGSGGAVYGSPIPSDAPRPAAVATVSDATLTEIANGRLSAQSAFMTGKLKVKGDMAVMMRLQSLFKELSKPAPASSSSAKPKSAAASGNASPASQVFHRLNSGLKSASDSEREALVKKSSAVFKFELKDAQGKTSAYILDLKDAKLGKIEFPDSEATADKRADATISMTDSDFVDLVSGKLASQKAFASGKLKIRGQMMLAMKLDGILKSLQGKTKL